MFQKVPPWPGIPDPWFLIPVNVYPGIACYHFAMKNLSALLPRGLSARDTRNLPAHRWCLDE
jgi:hypothetical protein